MKTSSRKLAKALGVAILATASYGQTGSQINLGGNQVTGVVPAAKGGTGTAPGSSLPSTPCTNGKTFVKTSASPTTAALYACIGTAWVLQTGGGSPAGYTSVPYSTTPTFTASSTTGSSFLITLNGGNVISSTLAGAALGQIITMNICQDGTGSRTFAFPPTMAGAGTIDSTASACTRQVFVWDGTNAQALSPAYSTGPPGISLAGSSSGSTLVQAQATASGTITVPSATDTLAGKATTDSFTNKTIDSAGTGNHIKIAGTDVTALSGTGGTICTTVGSLCIPPVNWTFAGCDNGTLGVQPQWSIPTSSGGVISCGGNLGILSVATFTNASDSSIMHSFRVPGAFTTAALKLTGYQDQGGSGNVKFLASIACLPATSAINTALTYGTASNTGSVATVATNVIQEFTVSAIAMTGCSSGTLAVLKLTRDTSVVYAQPYVLAMEAQVSFQ